MIPRQAFIASGISTTAGILLGLVTLMVINTSLLKIPLKTGGTSRPTGATPVGETPYPAQPDYKAISERNLFRARLEVEIPKPRSEKELEEEALTAIMKPMVLKGVMTGSDKKDSYAVIDRGGQKGVWTYEVGEVIERGLAVTEIKKDSVTIQKGDFGALLRLFAMSYERVPIVQPASLAADAQRTTGTKSSSSQKAAPPAPDYSKEIRREGKTVMISKPLADKIKSDNGVVMSAVAVKMSTDQKGQPNGYKVVSVDKGSIAAGMGLMPDDTVQEINGYKLNSQEDIKKAYDNLRGATKFQIKLLRKGKVEALSYEIR